MKSLISDKFSGINNFVVLLGYKKDKVSETRVVPSTDMKKYIGYMVEMDDKLTSIEELHIQPNGTTIYWQTHRVSDIKKVVNTSVESVYNINVED